MSYCFFVFVLVVNKVTVSKKNAGVFFKIKFTALEMQNSIRFSCKVLQILWRNSAVNYKWREKSGHWIKNTHQNSGVRDIAAQFLLHFSLLELVFLLTVAKSTKTEKLEDFNCLTKHCPLSMKVVHLSTLQYNQKL